MTSLRAASPVAWFALLLAVTNPSTAEFTVQPWAAAFGGRNNEDTANSADGIVARLINDRAT